MAQFVFSNRGASKLVASVTPGQTSIQVEDASSFPDLQTGQRFSVVLESVDRQTYEECLAVSINKSANSMVLLRGTGGEPSQSFAAGAYVENRVTKSMLNVFVQRTGDVMTGDLTVDGASTQVDDLLVKDTATFDKGGNLILALDSSGTILGTVALEPSGGSSLEFEFESRNGADVRIAAVDDGVVRIEDVRYPKINDLVPDRFLYFDGESVQTIDSPMAEVKSVFVPYTTGSKVEEDFNRISDWTGVGDQTTVKFTVSIRELWVLNHNGRSYLWSGGLGEFGSAAGGTTALPEYFSDFSSGLEFASPAEVQEGVTPDKSIAPDVAATELLRVSALSGPQTVEAPVSFMGDLEFGDAVTPITISAPGAALSGAPGAPLTIEDADINGGSF